jgi:hypothetical protein
LRSAAGLKRGNGLESAQLGHDFSATEEPLKGAIMRLMISLVLAASVLTGTAMAQSQSQPSANVPQGHINLADPADVNSRLHNYWTADRMQNAKPMEFPRLKRPANNNNGK